MFQKRSDFREKDGIKKTARFPGERWRARERARARERQGTREMEREREKGRSWKASDWPNRFGTLRTAGRVLERGQIPK